MAQADPLPSVDFNDFPSIDAYLPPRHDIRQEGDFYVEYIKLISYAGQEVDVTALRMELSLYEDLFSSTVSGVLVLMDSSDLPQLLPIIGEETVKVRYTRPSELRDGLLKESLDFEFRVYKMDKRIPSPSKEQSQIYVLHLISPEFIKQSQNPVQQSFPSMLYSDTVQGLFDAYIKVKRPISIDPSLFLQDYVAPNLTPYECISQICTKAISSTGKLPDMVFYDTISGPCFHSLSRLLAQPTSRIYNYQPGNVRQASSTHTDFLPRDIADDIYRVEAYKHELSFDILSSLSSGLYRQNLTAIDPIREIITEYEFDLSKEWDRFTHTEKNKSHVKPPTFTGPGSLKVVSTNKDHDILPWIASREKGILPSHIEDWVMHRIVQLKLLSSHKMHISVSGDPRRHVGQVIEFYPPNLYGAFDRSHPQDPPHDRYLSGRFLVTSCKHRLADNKYYNDMELVKDSFLEEIKGIDVNKTQDWTY